MKKETKFKIIDGTNTVLSIIIPSIAIIWATGLILNMIKDVNAQNYSYFINYAQISLTLFGFTLIGGIFERKKDKPKIVKELFKLSLAFLFSAISFLFMYSSMYIKWEGINMQIISYIFLSIFIVVGIFSFVYGLLYLFTVLFNYLKELI